MNRKWMTLGVVLAVVCGCAAPAPRGVVEPTQAMAEKARVPVATLQRGHSVYIRKCGECHELMMPADVSKADWHVVVPGMAWNAGISRADEDAVLQYILAAKMK